MTSLQRYVLYYNLKTPENPSKRELVSIVTDHFVNRPYLRYPEVISDFSYKNHAHNSGRLDVDLAMGSANEKKVFPQTPVTMINTKPTTMNTPSMNQITPSPTINTNDTATTTDTTPLSPQTTIEISNDPSSSLMQPQPSAQ